MHDNASQSPLQIAMNFTTAVYHTWSRRSLMRRCFPYRGSMCTDPCNNIGIQQGTILFKLAIVSIVGIGLPCFITTCQRLIKFMGSGDDNSLISLSLHDKSRNSNVFRLPKYTQAHKQYLN